MKKLEVGSKVRWEMKRPIGGRRGRDPERYRGIGTITEVFEALDNCPITYHVDRGAERGGTVLLFADEVRAL